MRLGKNFIHSSHSQWEWARAPAFAWALVSCFVLMSPVGLRAQANNDIKEGVSLFKEKKYEPAMKALLKGEQSASPEETGTYYEQALILHLKSILLCRKAEIALNENKLQIARQFYEECKKVSPHSQHVQALAGRLDTQIKKTAQYDGLTKEQFEKRKSLLASAQAALKAGNCPGAIAQWDLVLAISPGFQAAIEGKTQCAREMKNASLLAEAEVYFEKGVTLYRARKLVEARRSFNEYQRMSGGKKADGYIKKINEELDKKARQAAQEALALAAYNSAMTLKARAEYPDARESLLEGKSYAPKLKNWDKEIEAVNKLEEEMLRQSRGAKIAALNLNSSRGIAALAAEKLDSAVNYLSLAVKLARELELRDDLAKNEIHLKNAKEYLDKKEKEEVNEHSPFFPLVDRLLQAGYRQMEKGNYQAASKRFEEVRSLFPQNREANQNIIICQLKLNPDGAKQQLKELVRLGRELLDKRDFTGARLNFSIVKSVDPKYPEVDSLLKRAEGAVKNNLVKRTLSQAQADGMYKQAFGLYRGGKNNEALAMLRKILDGYPGHYNASNLKNRLQLAQNFQIKKPKTTPPQAVKHFTSGLRFYTSGQLEEARASFKRALAIAPNYTRARRALKRVERQLKQI